MQNELEIKRLKALLLEREATIETLERSLRERGKPASVAGSVEERATSCDVFDGECSSDPSPTYLDLQMECLVEWSRVASVGTWAYNADTKRVYWSEGVFDVHELDVKDGVPCLEECLSYFIEEDQTRISDALRQAQQDGGSCDLECELMTKTGVHKYVRVMGKRGQESIGFANCIFGVIQDITETRRIQDSLVEAKNHANAANQAKSNFLATVSHELRTPLNPVMGFAELLLEEVEDEDQLSMVSSIYESGQQLMETINGLIEFAELNPEKLKLRKDHFSISDLIDSVTSEMKENWPSFCIEVEQQEDPKALKGAMLVGDLEKVKCVLSSLLGNAAKFSGVSKVKLRSLLSMMDTKRVLWHVDVEDTGVGIDADMLDHIFAPFRHAGNTTTTRVQGGSGLGLAICQGYVELMDGQISVQSRKGVGTTFTFYLSLPLASDEEAAIDTEEQRPSQAKSRKKLSVLMIEDNAGSVYYQGRILKELDCELTTATDGQQALDAYQPERFDLVLLDLHLPGISGLDVLKSIRESESRAGASQVPVIVLTADLLRSTETACREYGANEFIAKPVNVNELQLKIAAVLARH